MKVDVEELSPVKKIIHVEIPEKDVGRQLDKAYKNLKGSIKLKGFRPGKVPLALLEKRFWKQVHAEVSSELIQDSYSKALGEAELKPVSEPTLDPSELAKGQPYRYSATIEVCQVVEELNLKGFELREKIHTVDEEEINTHLKMLQKRNAQLKSVDENRAVKDKDIVIIDYEGFKDGKPVEAAGKTENFQVEIGSGRILKDFEDQLIGMELDNTKEIQVRFPDDYYNNALAGLDVSFNVTLREVKEEILPELDDEFAKDLGEYQTLEELKEALKEDLERRYEAESKRRLREDIIDKLIEQSSFELPSALVERELSGMVRDAQGLMAQKGVPPDQSAQGVEELSEKYRPMAERKVREYLLLEKVIEQEEISLTDEALDEAYGEIAKTLNQPVDIIKQYYESAEEARETFKQKALEKQAIMFIIDKSDVEKIEADKDTA
ncbi:MAG: trigger factor [Desulfobacterales bacterium S7086C20]|nr:MAG: trigger factor [Desulfobacterales bacterium S7086C20]